MKKSLLLFALLIVFSCKKQTPKEIARFNIEEDILKNSYNPDSYEFVEMGEFDTIYKKEKYKEKLNYAINDKKQISQNLAPVLKSEREMLEVLIKDSGKKENDNRRVRDVDYKEYINKRIIKCKKMINSLESTIKDCDNKINKYEKLYNESEKEIHELNVLFKCRAKNKSGTKILTTFKVYLNDSLKITKVKLVN